MCTVYEEIHRIGIIPVAKLDKPEEDSVPVAGALLEGGIPLIEVTFRADGAPTAIRKMKQEVPNFTVGAGTVLTVEQAEEAIEAGAEFIVSPGLDPAIVECCERKGVPVVPGCATASDCQAAYNMGLRIVKFFPANIVGGLPALRALHTPFSKLQFIPTGGITLDNLEEFSACPFVFACGGTFLLSEELIRSHDWTEITRRSRQAVELVLKGRRYG